MTAVVLAGFLLSGASAALGHAAAALAPAGSTGFSPAAVALYVTVLALVHESTTFPLAFYRGFFLEQRYGLSSEPLRRWLRDHAKASGIGLILGLAGAEIVYFTLSVTPAWWWLASSALFALGMMALVRIAPVVLLPMFYTITPLERTSLRERLVELSKRAGVPVLGIYQWNLGEKTRRANAALVGAGSTRRIIVSDTLLAEYSDDEIEVILAHEIAHHVHRDVLAALLAEALLLVIAFRAAAWTLTAWHGALRLRSPADLAALPLLLLAGGATMVAATPVVNALSRRNERRADSYALSLTHQPAAFISAMKRLAAQNLAEERPSRLALWLPDDECAFHLAAAIVLGEVAVEAVSADLVGAELERDALTRGGAFGDPILVDREAVGDIPGGEGDLDQVVLLHFDLKGREGELVSADRELAGSALRRGPHRSLGGRRASAVGSRLCVSGRDRAERGGKRADRHTSGRDDGFVPQLVHGAPRIDRRFRPDIGRKLS
jgi:STE24 endopeptidase